MIYWAPFLHFYQPPTQFHAVLKKISDESYRPLVKLFQSHPEAKVTINMCGSLTELLMNHGQEDIIDGLSEVGARGQLEFVGSSKYHAILPLIPDEEIRRQIEINQQTNKYFLKEGYRPKGFFPPEMCYSDKIVAPIKDAGFNWIIVSGVACGKNKWPVDSIYRIKSPRPDMQVVFRDDILSNKISFHGITSKGFLERLVSMFEAYDTDTDHPKKDIYFITAMDAETFGHHIKHWEKVFLQELYEKIAAHQPLRPSKKRKGQSKDEDSPEDTQDKHEVRVVTISELVELFPKAEAIELRPSSWSTTDQDIEQQNYYPLWNDPSNTVNKLQWESLDICLELVKKAAEPSHMTAASKPFVELARSLLDKALYSCQWWWASKRPMWDINLINKGLTVQEEVLFNAFKAISLSQIDESAKKNYYHKLIVARDISSKIRDILLS